MIPDKALAEDHTLQVKAWAEGVWRAWTGGHGIITTLASLC
jgi:hypothetical protein